MTTSPTSFKMTYESPLVLYQNPYLTAAEKTTLLREWQTLLEAEMLAADEGMAPTAPSAAEEMKQIHDCLLQLEHANDVVSS